MWESSSDTISEIGNSERMRCTYCGKETEGEYCSEYCRERTARFQDNAEKNAKWLILGIVLSLLIIPVSYAAGRPHLAVLCMAGIGLTFLIFPYGTPETNSRGGVRRGILYVRSASAAMIAAALVLSYLFSI